MDLLDYPAIDRLGASIFERWGKLDILIGNAAILGQLAPIHHYDPNIWDEVIGVNLTANYRLLRSLDPLLRISQNGRIIFLSSDISDGLHPYWGAYAISKSGLETMVFTYARETERLALRINIVDPGPTATNLRAGAFPGEDQRKIQRPETAAKFIYDTIFDQKIDHGAILKR
jgi:NAD(P)-dependent dehydrogenase (short-subunit alcohol dehydrogenase family)